MRICVCLVWFIVLFFFFKQKTAYEMLRSLVGSEMCIRDRADCVKSVVLWNPVDLGYAAAYVLRAAADGTLVACLLYTSDAADDLLCVDLGGRRIIKKKNKIQKEI